MSTTLPERVGSGRSATTPLTSTQRGAVCQARWSLATPIGQTPIAVSPGHPGTALGLSFNWHAEFVRVAIQSIGGLATLANPK
jgi:hypothetical protein